MTTYKKMIISITFLAAIIVFIICFLFTNKTQNFSSFSNNFVSGIKALKVPELELSYVSGLEHIGSLVDVEKQLSFFSDIKSRLSQFKFEQLTEQQKIDFNLISYETDLNLVRIDLELSWLKNKPDAVSSDGIITIPNGKAWYAYLLKRWTSADVTPDEIYQFGLEEIGRVQQRIEDIRVTTGMSVDDFYLHLNDPSFFLHDPKLVHAAFENIGRIVEENLPRLFFPIKVPPLTIARGENIQLAQTPGFYDDNVFYFNHFDKPYNKRQMGWLFIHEAIPGHHYQMSIEAQTKISPVQKLFYYMGFAEGWAAYTEGLGKELGVYQTPYDELGKWEWDLVRSVRVSLDVALNYYGWTDEKALDFWQRAIRGQDDIAMREIKRMRNWPAQVVTYKYGARQISEWKEELEREQGDNFSIKQFHANVLDHGSLPLFMVKNNCRLKDVSRN